VRNLPIPILTALVAACPLPPLAGQTAAQALGRVPSDATFLEVYRNAPGLNARVAAALGEEKAATTSVVDIYRDLGLDPAAQTNGTVVVAEFPNPSGKGTRSVTWLPAKDVKALGRALHAKPSKELLKAQCKGTTYFLLRQGPFALVAKDAALLRRVGTSTRSLGDTLQAVLPWVERHDFCVVTPPVPLAKGLKSMRSAMAKPGAASMAVPAAIFGPLLDQAEASISLAGLGVDLPQGGGIRAEGRVFFKAGSPLTTLGLAALAGHPLQGLDPAGMVLGAGGVVPECLAEVSARMSTAQLPPDKAAQATPLLEAMVRNQTSMAFRLGVPAEAGAPLLGSVTSLVHVKDLAAYFDQNLALQAFQAPAMEALGLKTELAQDVLPGTPSFTRTFRVDGSHPGPFSNVQFKMLATLLLGSSEQVQFSAAKLDDHTVLSVLGDAKALQEALAHPAPDFAADPGVAAVDALLPQGALWRFYLDPANARTLVQRAMDGFKSQGAPTLPAVTQVPPLGMAISLDGAGASLTGAVTPDTVKALKVLFSASMAVMTPAGAVKP
jgi:hypothetical protein